MKLLRNLFINILCDWFTFDCHYAVVAIVILCTIANVVCSILFSAQSFMLTWVRDAGVNWKYTRKIYQLQTNNNIKQPNITYWVYSDSVEYQL